MLRATSTGWRAVSRRSSRRSDRCDRDDQRWTPPLPSLARLAAAGAGQPPDRPLVQFVPNLRARPRRSARAVPRHGGRVTTGERRSNSGLIMVGRIRPAADAREGVALEAVKPEPGMYGVAPLQWSEWVSFGATCGQVGFGRLEEAVFTR